MDCLKTVSVTNIATVEAGVPVIGLITVIAVSQGKQGKLT